MKKVIVHSYDIFDTCLVRACGKSVLAFDILAKEVLGANAEMSEIRDFALIRVNGERKAKDSIKFKEDVTIEEIYSYCDFTPLTSKPNDYIQKKELEVESNILVPVYSIKKEIELLHERGNNVIFISDMYLPSIFIKSLLTKYGLFTKGDKLYVSGEIGKTKISSNLYKYIREKEDIDYKSWIHKGDNDLCDVEIPRMLGIKSLKIEHKYSYYEKKCISWSGAAYLDVFKTNSISKAIISFFPKSPYILFSADFVAPIYVPFVYGIMKDAKKRGINNLYFLARDGYILYHIAKQFKNDFPQLNIKYLYVSRISLYLPGLRDISIQSLSEFVTDANRDIETVLEYFKLQDFCYEKKSYKDLRGSDLLIELMNDEEFVEALTVKHKEQKELCLDYFKQEGLTDDNSAIVDCFGTRRCQQAINNILSSRGFDKVYGYYFDVVSYRVFEGEYSALNYDENRAFLNSNLYLGPQGVFEQYFSITDHGRTSGYQKDEKGLSVPVYDPIDKDEYYANKVLDSNMKCCSMYARFFSYMQPLCERRCEENAMKSYSDFCFLPRKEYLIALANLSITSIGVKIKLLQKKSLLSIVRNRNTDMWYYGNLIYNSGFLYHIVRIFLKFLLKIRRNVEL